MKQIPIFFLILALIFGVTACAGEPQAEELPRETITLMASDLWIRDAEVELFEQFTQETGIAVKVLLTPDNAYEHLLNTILAGGGSSIDLFMYPVGGGMVAAGIPKVALDLTEEPWVEQLEPWAAYVNTVEGRIVGFPSWGIDWEGVLYNKSLFQEQGWQVPETWEEFLRLCDRIQEAGIAPLYQGINSVSHMERWLCALTYPMKWENREFTKQINQGTLKFSEMQTLQEGLTQIREFFAHKPAYWISDGQSEDWQGSYAAMQNREAAMILTYSAYAQELEQLGSTDQWGMFPLPLLDSGATVTNGGGYSKYINRNSLHIDACRALLNFLAREENQVAYNRTRTDLISAGFRFEDVELSNMDNPVTVDLMANSRDMSPVTMKNDLLFWDPEIYAYLQGFVQGTMTVEQFVGQLDNYQKTSMENWDISPENLGEIPSYVKVPGTFEK